MTPQTENIKRTTGQTKYSKIFLMKKILVNGAMTIRYLGYQNQHNITLFISYTFLTQPEKKKKRKKEGKKIEDMQKINPKTNKNNLY